ncbi:M56 family metallopeptidase [Prosthecobacter sp.]|uniref:M56 family metallopeptidase n=1 Tax=Prosthecobacter sp. TaxID=1965333 RepID=UPI003782FE06
MNDWMQDLLRFLTRNPNLGLMVSAFLTSSAVVCVAGCVALQLQRRSARARSLVWRITMMVLLLVAAWRLMPEAAPPVAVMEWRVNLPAPPVEMAPVLSESPAFVLPEKTLWQRGLAWLESESVKAWLAVALLLLCRRILTAWAGLFWLRQHSRPAPEHISKRLREMNAPARLHCRVAERLQSPMLSGWRRPVIWLPPEASTWDEQRLGAVLQHELAHLRRGDVAWHWLAQLTVCLWWWQPLALRAWHSLRNETEHAADDAAVLAGGSTQDYARTLVEIAAGLPSRMRKMPGVTMFGGESVQRRVRELMKSNQWRGRIGIGAMSLIALVAVVLAVLAATKVEFKPKTPVYQSEAILVAGGFPDAGGNWQAQHEDFYGTIVETLESAEMKRRALERVRVLNPNLEGKNVEVQAAQTKGSTLFRVQTRCESGKYARIFLDALLDEFIGFRQSVREQAAGQNTRKLAEEAVKAQKVMEDKLAALAEFQKLNNLLTLTNGNDMAAQFLGKLASQLNEARTNLAEEELALSSIPAAMTIAQTRVSSGQPLTQTEKDYVQSQSELRRLENELKYLLETHKADHTEVVATKEKVAKAKFLLNALVEPLREEMEQRAENSRRRVTILQTQMAEKQKEALHMGAKIAQYQLLDKQAKAAREAYEKLFDHLKQDPRLAANTDYVAIQERASPATEVVQSGLLPIWKLWRGEAKPAAEKTPTTAQKGPAKTAG